MSVHTWVQVHLCVSVGCETMQMVWTALGDMDHVVPCGCVKGVPGQS